MVHHQNDILALAPFPGPERIGISVIFALLLKLGGPLFLKLLAVFHLVPLQGPVPLTSVPLDTPSKWITFDKG